MQFKAVGELSFPDYPELDPLIEQAKDAMKHPGEFGATVWIRYEDKPVMAYVVVRRQQGVPIGLEVGLVEKPPRSVTDAVRSIHEPLAKHLAVFAGDVLARVVHVD